MDQTVKYQQTIPLPIHKDRSSLSFRQASKKCNAHLSNSCHHIQQRVPYYGGTLQLCQVAFQNYFRFHLTKWSLLNNSKDTLTSSQLWGYFLNMSSGLQKLIFYDPMSLNSKTPQQRVSNYMDTF